MTDGFPVQLQTLWVIVLPWVSSVRLYIGQVGYPDRYVTVPFVSPDGSTGQSHVSLESTSLLI